MPVEGLRQSTILLATRTKLLSPSKFKEDIQRGGEEERRNINDRFDSNIRLLFQTSNQSEERLPTTVVDRQACVDPSHWDVFCILFTLIFCFLFSLFSHSFSSFHVITADESWSRTWGEVRWGEVRWGEVRWGEVRWGEVRWGEVRCAALWSWVLHFFIYIFLSIFLILFFYIVVMSSLIYYIYIAASYRLWMRGSWKMCARNKTTMQR